MNRMDEYKNLLTELESVPPAVEFTVARAKARLKKRRTLKRFFVVPAGSLAAFFAAFVVLVNVSMTTALACSRIPLLRELAAAVSFSPSLKIAIENDYVQPVGLEQTLNGITMRIEYVIVDQKQLNIFFTLHSDIYSYMSASPEIRQLDGSALGGYGLTSGGGEENGVIRKFTADFIENDVPDGIKLSCRVHDNGSLTYTEPVAATDDMLFQREHKEPDAISVFEFELNFDPSYTAQSEIIAVNRTFTIDGQTLTLVDAEIYPTHMRINFDADPNNTAWLTSLTFEVENEKGERFESISNGISATGSHDSPMMRSYHLESAFFTGSKHLTLHITEATWLDKDKERVRLDLANCEADFLPLGITFAQAVRKGSSWVLTFSQTGDEVRSQPFLSTYYDEYGNEYMYNSSSHSSSYYDEATGEYVEGIQSTQFALVDYPYDVVDLTLNYSSYTPADAVVEIR